MKVDIDGFSVSCFKNITEAVDKIYSDLVFCNEGTIAVAVNPEKILKARRVSAVRESLKSADLLYLDGIGTVKVAERKLKCSLSRIPGCDLWQALMAESSERQARVFLLGSDQDVVEQTSEKLFQQYQVSICGYHNGYFIDQDEMIDEIIRSDPDILTVAMGSPKQELFMEACRNRGLKCFMMGVGGTYNVFTGKVKRAPKIWRELGLEWLYRMVKEPKRIYRQLGLLRFLYLYLLKKI